MHHWRRISALLALPLILVGLIVLLHVLTGSVSSLLRWPALAAMLVLVILLVSIIRRIERNHDREHTT